MKRILSFFAMIFGLFSLMFGTSSCNEEKCCTWESGGFGTYNICEEELPKDGFTSWSQVVSESNLYGGSCD